MGAFYTIKFKLLQNRERDGHYVPYTVSGAQLKLE